MNPINLEHDSTTVSQPQVVELLPAPSVEFTLAAMSSMPHCVLFDSSRAVESANGSPLGRYSFLAADPFEWIEISGNDPVNGPPLAKIAEALSNYKTDPIPGLPPFQGGCAGLLSYDFSRQLEKIPAPCFDEFKIPALAFGIYDCVIAWDHQSNQAWIISHGFPESDSHNKTRRAVQRVEQFQELLRQPANRSSAKTSPAQISIDHLAPTSIVAGPDGLLSNFDDGQYLDAVRTAIEYIHAGDVFQINLSQRLLFPAAGDAVSLYQRLRKRNPAPFSGFLDLGNWQIASASPERLVSVREGMVETRPIKGTRKRTRFPTVDLHSSQELRNSEKDLAENTMIVDLMRNDLSRVCTDDSIVVTQFCELEQYESVFHLVSAVRGKLMSGCDVIDLLTAVFPGGSVTGAPKVRAMEIISELEPSSRGAYCGSLGYIGFDGNADFNILIRTVTAAGGWWQIPVGGGIVAQSDPQAELQETWTKAAGMLRALAES